MVVLLDAQTALFGAVQVFIVVIALELLDLGDGGVGYLNAAIGVGAFIGAVGALSLTGAQPLSPAFLVGSSSSGLPLVALGLWQTVAVAVSRLRSSSASGSSFVDVAGLTLVQRAVPDDVLARVFGVIQMLLLASHGHRCGTRAGAHRLARRSRTPSSSQASSCPPSSSCLRSDGRRASTRGRRLRRRRAATPRVGADLRAASRRLPRAPRVAARSASRRASDCDRARGRRRATASTSSPRATLDVSQDGTESPSSRAGDYFGEIALLRDTPAPPPSRHGRRRPLRTRPRGLPRCRYRSPAERRGRRDGHERASCGSRRHRLPLVRELSRAPRRRHAPGKIRTCGLCLRRAALYPLSYGRGDGKSSCAHRALSERGARVARNLDPDVAERSHRSPSRAALVTRPTTLPSNVSSASYAGQLGPVDLEHAQRPVHASAVVLPGDRLLTRDSTPSRSRPHAPRARPRPGGRDRRSRGRSAESRRGCAALRARLRRSLSTLELVVDHLVRRHPVVGGRMRPVVPRARRRRDDECTSLSISHFIANRERRSVERTRSPSPASVRSRKSSTALRSTTSGAITRAFGVRRRASHASPTSNASTSFETIACR